MYRNCSIGSGRIPAPAYNGISFKGIEKAVGRLAAISSKSTSEEKTEGKSNSCKDRVGFQHNIQSFPAQIATAWAIAKGTLPIIGVTKVHQVEEAAQTSKIKLTNDEVAYLEKLANEANVHTLREWEKDMD